MQSSPERSATLDALCRRLALARDRLAVPLSRVAHCMVRQSIWHACGYARASDFTRERLHRGSRWLRDLARLHDVLLELPPLAAALCGDDGKRPIGRVAALRIGRVATPQSVVAWIDVARSGTVRSLSRQLREARESGSHWPAGSAPCEIEAKAHSARSTGARFTNGPKRMRTQERANPESSSDCSEDESQSDDIRASIRLPVPGAVLAAFEETLDLHRAVVGRDTLVTDFIDALTAESCAANSPIDDVDMRPVARARAMRHQEETLARVTKQWSHLDAAGTVDAGPGSPDASRAADVRAVESTVRDAFQLLAQYDALQLRAGAGASEELVRQMTSLIKIEEDIEIQLGNVLAVLGQNKAWRNLQFAGVGHYGVERLGMCRTTAEDRARLARALGRLPLVRRAYKDGRIGAEAALLLCRLLERIPAQRHVERAWSERAAHVTIKRLRDEVRIALRRHMVGSRAHELESLAPLRPPDLSRVSLQPVAGWLRSDVTSCQQASAQAEPPSNDVDPIRVGTGPFPLEDRAWHDSLQRTPGDGARRVERLGLMAVQHPIPDVFLRLRLPDDVARYFVGGLEQRRRQLEAEANQAWEEDSDAWETEWECAGTAAVLRPSILAARMFGSRGRRPPTWIALLAMLEDYAHTWDQPSLAPRRAADAVYIRAGWRCTAPGCTSRQNLEDHHIVYRSRGGSNELGNRTCICRFHHQRGEHGGLAACRGQAPLDIVWRLGHGELARWYRNDRLLTPVNESAAKTAHSGRTESAAVRRATLGASPRPTRGVGLQPSSSV